MASDQLISVCIIGVFALIGLKARLFDRIRKPKQTKHAVK